MKKNLSILMACTTLFAIDPAFAMNEALKEDAKQQNFQYTHLEEIPYEKDEWLIPYPVMCGEPTLFVLNPSSLPDILQTPFSSTWYPRMAPPKYHPVHAISKRGENAASYTFRVGEKQLELYIHDQTKNHIDDSKPIVFFPATRVEFNETSNDVEKMEQYLAAKNNIFIREIKLSPDDPMFGQGVKLTQEKRILQDKKFEKEISAQ